MADEVGLEELELEANESEGFYLVKRYIAPDLPEKFRNFILQSFLTSNKSMNPMFKIVDRENYFSAYKIFADKLLSKPTCGVTLALLNDMDTILGWCLAEPGLLHYVYVKADFRRKKIASAISPKEFDRFSHLTNIGMSIWQNKFKKARFTPFV